MRVSITYTGSRTIYFNEVILKRNFIEWFIELRAVLREQRRFQTIFNYSPPFRNNILLWYTQFSKDKTIFWKCF